MGLMLLRRMLSGQLLYFYYSNSCRKLRTVGSVFQYKIVTLDYFNFYGNEFSVSEILETSIIIVGNV